MLGLLRHLRKKESPPVLFNLVIELKGWQGPFSSINQVIHVAKRIGEADSYRGAFRVLEDGKLKRGTDPNLHTFTSEVDVGQLSILFQENPHVHYNKSGLSYIIINKGEVFLDNLRRDDQRRKILGRLFREYGKPLRSPHPRYTLSGLYSTLPNEKMNTKIRALKETLKDHSNYIFNSISTRKETKLKLLEGHYRRIISDQ